MNQLLIIAGALALAASGAMAGAKCDAAKTYLEKNKTELSSLFKPKGGHKKHKRHPHGIERLKTHGLQKISDLEAAVSKSDENRCLRLQQSLESNATRVKAGK